MSFGGRTTRSKRRFAEQHEPLHHHHHHDDDQPPAKFPHLNEHTILTPPCSQLPDEGRKTNRRGRPVRQQYMETTSTPMKTRHGASSSGSGTALDASTSSSEPTLTTFHTEDIGLDYGFDLWQNMGGLASENDPFLNKADGGDSTDSSAVNRSRDLHTPTPPMSPDMDVATPMMHRPDTPTIRPETPGDMGNPLTPMDGGSLVSSSMEVESHSMIGYGPPPTPMCPPARVGTLSTSSSLVCSQLPVSSRHTAGSSSSTATPNFAAPPHNILDSEEEEEEEEDNYNNDDDNVEEGHVFLSDDDDDDNNAGTHTPPTYINNNATSPDIVSEPLPPISLLASSSSSIPPENFSPPSSPPPPTSSSIKHSQRLRIRAFVSSPPPRSCPPVTISSPSNNKSVSRKRDGSGKIMMATSPTKVVARPILKSRAGSTESPEGSRFKLNFLNKSKPIKKVSYSNDVQKIRDGGGGGGEPPSFKVSIMTSPHTLNRLRLHSGGGKGHSPAPSAAKASGGGLKQVGRRLALGASSTKSKSKQEATSSTSTRAACRFQPPPPSPHLNLRDNSQKQDGCFLFLRLINFMAHKHLYCEWDQNIVFINGQNGSGKSAILTACQLVVGYKAANTNRASSVTGFIKNGCTYAIIEAGLTNYNGSLSQSIYGEVVTISRKIHIRGGSTYKLGSMGDSSKEQRVIHLPELNQIRQRLQIDPNNPVQFLQQEQLHRSSNNNSKAGSSRGGKKDFQMLKDATHLTEQETLLSDADENFGVAKKQIADRKEHRKFLILQEKQLKEQCDLVTKIEESENCIQKLKNEQKWAEVKILEEEQIRIKSRKEETFLEIKNLKEERKKLEDEMAAYSSKKDKGKKMILSIKKELNQSNNDKEAKINELREVTKTLHRVQNDHTLILKAIKGYSKKIAELEAQLNEDTISYEEQNQVHRQEIEKCQSMIPEKEADLEKLREKSDDIVAEFNEFKARERKGRENIKKMESELNQAKRELNKKDNFGPGMKELLEDKIPRNKWNIMPVGPLGAHIVVNDERYAPLVEHILGHSALYAFVVQNADDFKKLRGLIAEVYHDKRGKGREPTVIQVGQVNIPDYMKKLRQVEDKLAGLGFRTVLSMLKIKDLTVKMGIIERTSCERIVLFENFQTAAEVMKDERKTPKEVSTAYTLQWYRVTAYPRYQFQPVNPIKRHTEIIPMANASTAIHIKEEIAREREVIETCQKSLRGYDEQGVHRAGLEQILKNSHSEIQARNREINQLTNKIKHAQSMIKESPVQGQDKNIQNQIKAEQDMRAEQEMKIQVRLQEIELAKQEITRIAEEKDRIDAKIEEVLEKSAELEEEYGNAMGFVSKIEKSKEGYSSKIEKLEKEFHQLSLQETKVVDDMNDRIKQAVEAGERPKVLERSPVEIKRETEELEVFLNNNKDIVMSKKRITLEYLNSRSLVKKITMEINVVEMLLFEYDRYLKMGQDVVAGLKMNISNLLESNFQTYTELHNLTGKLMVLWEKETLIYYVSPDKHSDARARQSISVVDGEVVMADKQGMQNYCSNLSGGERAKAQIFFIMSMWEITDLPCHFVDEFETFMDERSRIRIQRFLIKHAKKHPDKQFFFFTPQILKGVPRNDPSIKIMVLKKVKGQKDEENKKLVKA